MKLPQGSSQLTIILIGIIVILIGGVGFLVWKLNQLTPPVNPTPPPSTQKSLKLLYPTGGETLKEGETYTIKWEAKGIKKVNIEYGDGKGYEIVRDYPADKGEYQWTPEGIVKNYEGFVGRPLAEVKIKIAIWASEDPNLLDKSDDITLISEETANWKTYRNEKYGFEIRYPPTLTLTNKQFGTEKENEWWLYFSDRKAPYVNLYVTPQLSVLLPGTFGGRFSYSDSSSADATETYQGQNLTFTIDYWVKYGGAGDWDSTINAYFKKNNLFYILSFYWPFEAYTASLQAQKSIIEQRIKAMKPSAAIRQDTSNFELRAFYLILSSFRFI